MLRILAFSILVTLGSQQASKTPTKPTPALLAQAFVQALTQASLARDDIEADNGEKPADRISGAFNSMVTLRRAMARLQQGILGLRPYTTDPDERIREAAQAFETVLERLQAGFQQSLDLEEALLKVKTEDEMIALVPKASEVASSVGESWRTLPRVVAFLTFALVDQERLVDGKLRYLRITTAERKGLVAEVTRLFPNSQVAGGGHAVDVTAKLLRQWLLGEWKSADEDR